MAMDRRMLLFAVVLALCGLEAEFVVAEGPTPLKNLSYAPITTQFHAENSSFEQLDSNFSTDHPSSEFTTYKSSVGLSTEQSTVGLSTEQSSVRLSTEQSTVGFTTEKSTSEITSQQSTFGLSTEQSTVGLSTEQSTVGLSTEQSTVGLSTEQSTVLLSTGQSSVGLSTEQSTVLLSTEQSTVGLSTEQSTVLLSTEQSTVGLSTEQSTVGLSTEQSTAGLSTEQSTVLLSTEQSSVGLTTEQSTVLLSTGQSSVGLSTEHSTVLLSTGQSSVALSTEQSTVGLSTEQSTVGLSTEQSTVGMSTEQSAAKFTTQKPTVEEQSTEQQTSELSTQIDIDVPTPKFNLIKATDFDTFENTSVRQSNDEQKANQTDYRRTVIFLKIATNIGEHVFIRGGVNDAPIPIRHRALNLRELTPQRDAWAVGDNYLDWDHDPEPAQTAGREWGRPNGTPAQWTTNRKSAGYFHPLNIYGDNYWIVDVMMDCSKTQNGFFEFQGILQDGAWEGGLDLAYSCRGMGGQPWVSTYHIAVCGKINVFFWGTGVGCEVKNFP